MCYAPIVKELRRVLPVTAANQCVGRSCRR